MPRYTPDRRSSPETQAPTQERLPLPWTSRSPLVPSPTSTHSISWALASDLIRIPSFSPDETPAARFLADYFRPRGYDVVMQEVEPGRFQTIATLKAPAAARA